MPLLNIHAYQSGVTMKSYEALTVTKTQEMEVKAPFVPHQH